MEVCFNSGPLLGQDEGQGHVTTDRPGPAQNGDKHATPPPSPDIAFPGPAVGWPGWGSLGTACIAQCTPLGGCLFTDLSRVRQWGRSRSARLASVRSGARAAAGREAGDSGVHRKAGDAGDRGLEVPASKHPPAQARFWPGRQDTRLLEPCVLRKACPCDSRACQP